MNISINSDHILTSSDYQIQDLTALTKSKNSKTYAEKNGILDTIIMHYTGGRDAASSAKYLAEPDVKASAHLVIGRDGEVYQLVPFNLESWHAGVSSYGGRNSFNKYAIGIELDNAGVLTKVGNNFQAWFGKNYPENEVIHATHRNETSPRYWHAYTQKQLERTLEITELLVATYSIKNILGHEEISPGRKQDPGPAFELDRFRNGLLVNRKDVDDEIANRSFPFNGAVTVDKLNIRESSGTTYDKVAKPLVKGQEVEVLQEVDGWYQVKTTITGWIGKDYIELKS